MEELEQISYKSAMEELQQILQSIENSNTDIDLLSQKLRRAGKLIALCKQKLSKIEVDTNKLIADMESGTKL